jgi:phosphoribosylaminoimidazole-succinocarboxamide synthase
MMTSDTPVGASAGPESVAGTFRVDLPFPLLKEGKVREMYDFGPHLLLVATDRISAFDCVLPDPIPHKGSVLTQVSRFWFQQTRNILQNHLEAVEADDVIRQVPELADSVGRWAGRGMLVERTEPFAVECVVRGYLSGSAWKEYRVSGTLAGEPLPEGLKESSPLPAPIFSPATKAEEGHDENITFDGMCRIVGIKTAGLLRDLSLELYEFGRDLLAERGIILADTKFEFGTSRKGEILLIDEVLTPDSSRFWPADQYAPGRGQPSLDKQPLRDYLEGLVQKGEWDKTPPAPALPGEVVEETTNRYLEAYRRVVGHDLAV